MHPILGSLGPLHFYSYGLCLALALGVSIYLFARDAGKYIAPKVGLPSALGFQKVLDLAVWVVLSSILGARLFYVLENYAEFQGRWIEAFYVWQGGLVFYGGLLAALWVSVIWVKREKWPLAYSCDLVIPYILLGQAIGRVGCYLNGCCYGIVDPVHGVVFPGAPDNLPHLPTQLWELYGDLTLFFLLLWARRWLLPYSWLSFSLYGLTYGTLRYFIEFWRRSWEKRYLGVFVSASQTLSAVIILAALLTLAAIWLKRRKSQPPPVV